MEYLLFAPPTRDSHRHTHFHVYRTHAERISEYPRTAGTTHRITLGFVSSSYAPRDSTYCYAAMWICACDVCASKDKQTMHVGVLHHTNHNHHSGAPILLSVFRLRYSTTANHSCVFASSSCITQILDT